jgi:DNA modification methylase
MISEVKNIDCIEGMKAFPDKFFDLAIVDPPYGIGDGKNLIMARITIDTKNIFKWLELNT